MEHHLFIFCLVQDYTFKLKPFSPHKWLAVIAAASNAVKLDYVELQCYRASSAGLQEQFSSWIEIKPKVFVKNSSSKVSITQTTTQTTASYVVLGVFTCAVCVR
jgi:hypothetical protein